VTPDPAVIDLVSRIFFDIQIPLFPGFIGLGWIVGVYFWIVGLISAFMFLMAVAVFDRD